MCGFESTEPQVASVLHCFIHWLRHYFTLYIEGTGSFASDSSDQLVPHRPGILGLMRTPPSPDFPSRDASPFWSTRLPSNRSLDCPVEYRNLGEELATLLMHRWPMPHERVMSPLYICLKGNVQTTIHSRSPT